MKIKPIAVDPGAYPGELQPLLSGAALYDSSCSELARVIYIDKDGGYFLKSAAAGSLKHEAVMTRYFDGKGLAAQPLLYISDESDWLLTRKVRGVDCTAAQYLDNPERLCDTLAECLAALHRVDHAGCPAPNHTERYLAEAERNYRAGCYDRKLMTGNWNFTSVEEAWRIVATHGCKLQSDTLLHGDYCLPNIILDDWKFSGYIDLDHSGVGDRHVDLYWALWSLSYNLRTDAYRQRFLDAYGRERVDEEMLRVIAAVEIFG